MTGARRYLLKFAAACVLSATVAAAVLACYHPATPCGEVFYQDGHVATMYCAAHWGMP